VNPLAIAATAAELDGLSFLRAMAKGDIPPAPIAQHLGFADIREIEHGHVVFRGVPKAEYFNPIGSIHGGWAMTLLDSAMGCAVHTSLPAGTAYTSLEVKTNFTRKIGLETGPVLAVGELVHRGTKIATAEGRLVAEETGKLLAHASTTCLISPPPAARSPQGG
jgi:uncharacterized protein (TIGR00369 family)